MREIGKSFARVRVLESVDLDVRRGEVHVLAGENGAGKTTLMRILCGTYANYDGSLVLEGERVRFSSVCEAAHSGISMIHQELSLVPFMSVLDNVFLGRERVHACDWLDRRGERRVARELLAEVGLAVDLDRPVAELPVSVRQRIEIAKALAMNARVLVMDEPTSALSGPEVSRLFALMERLKRRGCGIIFISHKMDEIYRVADRITVLRDGRKVGMSAAAELDRQSLLTWMVGREVEHRFPARSPGTGGERLRAEAVTVSDPSGGRRAFAEDVSFTVGAGEVLGVAGLAGAGNDELLQGLFGAYGALAGGQVWIDGQPVRVGSPRVAIARGMVLLTNDRQRSGLVLSMSVEHNITLASLARFCRAGWLRPHAERAQASRVGEEMHIQMRGVGQPVEELSGGNQQKVALAKCLAAEPRVLLLDEPTRGIDVGAKQDVYGLIRSLAARGMAIVLITSEMPELIALSDRIVVMHRGRIVAEMAGRDTSQEDILRAAMGRAAA